MSHRGKTEERKKKQMPLQKEVDKTRVFKRFTGK